MAQLFSPGTTTLFRVACFVLPFALVAVVMAATGEVGVAYEAGTERVLRQPVPFSHAHHVGGLGLDCRYCHDSVETSSSAGMPATSTCMNCHAQLWTDAEVLAPVRESAATGKRLAWVRVHDLPDFVFFDHSIHVQKGIGCETCHGRVDRMPRMCKEHTLFMDWCLDCHRDPARYVRPRSAVFDMGYVPERPQSELGPELVREHGIRTKLLTDCHVCHR